MIAIGFALALAMCVANSLYARMWTKTQNPIWIIYMVVTFFSLYQLCTALGRAMAV